MRATLLKLLTIALVATPLAWTPAAHAQDAAQINQIDGYYQRFLGRPAEPTGLFGYAAQLSRGVSCLTIESEILGSPEYFTRTGGTDAGFVAGLYRDVLGVSPTPMQISQDLVRLQQLQCNRQLFAAEFLQTRRVYAAPVVVQPTVVQTYRPVYVTPPHHPHYRPAHYVIPAYVAPAAAVGIRTPGFGLGVAVR